MVTQQRVHGYSPEEYLDHERNRDTRYEYCDGDIVGMSGASKEHHRITVNLTVALGNQFDGRPCEVFATDIRVRAAESRGYYYPDVSGVCGEPHFDDSGLDTLLNPIVVIEVLSPSTESRDRTVKFDGYRSMESMVAYLLIHQDTPLVEVYMRQDNGHCEYEVVTRLDSDLVIPAIACTLKLADIYKRLSFPPTLRFVTGRVGL